MRRLHHVGFPLLGLLLAFILVLTACLHDDSVPGGSFLIEPRSVTLGPDEITVILHAVGGVAPLIWSVTDPTRGEVSGDGETVTYVSTGELGVNTVEVMDGRAFIATATITQTDAVDEPLTLTPSEATIDSDGGKVVFAASGGTPAYRWSIGNESRGSFSVKNDAESIYKRLSEGDNTITVVDQRGFAAVGSISQPASPPLAISPSSATVNTNGTLVFTAAGGTGAYTWSIASGAGIVSPATGSSTVFTSVDGNTDVVGLSDGVTTVFATVGKQ